MEPRPDGRITRSVVMDSGQIRSALEELVDELVAGGVTARIVVVGGAAMVLAFYERAATGDVDAVFYPAPEVLAAAGVVAERRSLRADWLNNAAGQFLPATGYETGQVVIDRDGVTVSVGSAELLLAMKVRAARPSRDSDDIAMLIRACGLTTFDAVVEVYERIYDGEELLKPTGRVLIERALGEVEITSAQTPFTVPAVKPP